MVDILILLFYKKYYNTVYLLLILKPLQLQQIFFLNVLN